MESAGCVPSKVIAAVEEVLNEVNNSTAHLEKSIEELRAKLAPVLLALPQCATHDKQSEDKPRCAIESSIKVISNRILNQAKIINTIRDELQI